MLGTQLPLLAPNDALETVEGKLQGVWSVRLQEYHSEVF